jgi:hypothetical protein
VAEPPSRQAAATVLTFEHRHGRTGRYGFRQGSGGTPTLPLADIPDIDSQSWLIERPVGFHHV